MLLQKNNLIIKRALVVLLFLVTILLIVNLNIYIPCLFHEITNLYCPGCGITRMFISIFKLDFYQAFRYNPLCFILLPIIIPYILYLVYMWVFNKTNKINKYVDKVILVITVLLIIYGIIRNIDTYSYLRPTIV